MRCVFVFDACKIVVVSRLQTLNGWTAAQVHKENVHYRRAYHKERAYRTSDFESGFLCDKLVGHINQRGKQHGEEHKHQIVPKVFAEALRAPDEKEHEKPAYAHHIGNPHIQSDVALCKHARKYKYARNYCQNVGDKRQKVVAGAPHYEHKRRAKRKINYVENTF